jgi:hypothetical protein
MTFAGIPLWVVGVVCLIIATIYFIFWPRPRQAGRFHYLVLRWFHGLVWVFLGASAFVAPQTALGGTTTATVLALMGLGSYIIFMISLFRDRLARTKSS